MRGPTEPPAAYQFCLANDRLDHRDGVPGVIIQQPSGCFGFWEGEKSLHASSCDPRRVHKTFTADSAGSTGLVLTQKKLILNQTVKHKDNTARFADMESLKKRYKTGQEDWTYLKKHYDNEKDERKY
jgi:hypothetical protein